MAVRRLIDRYVYGEERLGHQTQLIEERVHRAMALICGATFALGGSLGLLMMYMVYLAMHVGEPVRPRGGVEADVSTTTETPAVGSGLPSHRATTLPPVCLEEPAFHRCLENETLPPTPRLEEWQADGHRKKGRRPWYFLRAASACLEWTPETLCLRGSRAHFASLEECLGDCDGDVPKTRCTHHLRTPLASNCSSSPEPEEGPWWFYDPLAQACRDWRNVCVRPAFVTYEDCAKRCKPRRSISTARDG